MANLINLKRRIKTAQNVSKTTKAMQMIATSKLKKAQQAVLAARPYIERLDVMVKNLTLRADKDDLHPYMKPNLNTNKSLVLVISPDKGLCGGLITNLIKQILQDNSSVSYLSIGKKGSSSIATLGKQIIAAFDFGTTLPSFGTVFPIIKVIEEYFFSKKVSNVKILYSSYTSIFSQVPKMINLLPINLPEGKLNAASPIFEPGPAEILPVLAKHYLEMTLYQYLLENYVSEQAARMLSMQNATDNALDIADTLKLKYNKSRQEKITNEILDIGGSWASSSGL